MYYLTVYNEPIKPAGRAGEPRRPGPAGRHVPLRRGPADRERHAKAQILASGRRRAVGAAGAGAAGQRLGRLGRRLVGDLVGPSCAGRPTRWPSTTCCTPRRSRRCPTSPSRLQDAARPGRRGVGLDAGGPRPASRRTRPHGMQSLGTDGFGLSDTRPALRRHFHVDAESIVVRTLASLADRGQLDRSVVRQAVEKYQIRDVQAAPAEERTGPQPGHLSSVCGVDRAGDPPNPLRARAQPSSPSPSPPPRTTTRRRHARWPPPRRGRPGRSAGPCRRPRRR